MVDRPLGALPARLGPDGGGDGGDGGLGLDVAAVGPLADSTSVPLAVVGAHLSGQPLNAQLVSLGARLSARTTTSASYRLVALAGSVPPKPGLARVGAGGAQIEVEVWDVPTETLGSFVAAIPSPLAIGKLELADGTWVSGFVCEPAGIDGAEDITSFGGWRAYLAHRGSP
jgi:allophanate hydrolase